MKKFCESLRKHTMKIINFKQKKIISLTTNSRNRMKRQKSTTFAKRSANINNTPMIKRIVELEIIAITQERVVGFQGT